MLRPTDASFQFLPGCAMGSTSGDCGGRVKLVVISHDYIVTLSHFFMTWTTRHLLRLSSKVCHPHNRHFEIATFKKQCNSTVLWYSDSPFWLLDLLDQDLNPVAVILSVFLYLHASVVACTVATQLQILKEASLFLQEFGFFLLFFCHWVYASTIKLRAYSHASGSVRLYLGTVLWWKIRASPKKSGQRIQSNPLPPHFSDRVGGELRLTIFVIFQNWPFDKQQCGPFHKLDLRAEMVAASHFTNDGRLKIADTFVSHEYAISFD